MPFLSELLLLERNYTSCTWRGVGESEVGWASPSEEEQYPNKQRLGQEGRNRIPGWQGPTRTQCIGAL